MYLKYSRGGSSPAVGLVWQRNKPAACSDVAPADGVQLLGRDMLCSTRRRGCAKAVRRRWSVLRPHVDLERELRRALPRERVITSPEELLVYGYDGTWLDSPPVAVVSPISTEEIAAVVRLAEQIGLPVVPGAGSGLAGGAVGQGGLVLNLTLMDRILEIDRDARVAVVQPGVVNARLQAAVEEVGLFYPPDPASLRQATVGGNVATAASGPRCLKYGGTREYVTASRSSSTTASAFALAGERPSRAPTRR